MTPDALTSGTVTSPFDRGRHSKGTAPIPGWPMARRPRAAPRAVSAASLSAVSFPRLDCGRRLTLQAG